MESGYYLAIMKFQIIMSPEAIQDFKGLNAHDRAEIKDLMETHLRHEPMKTSKSRIKRLRGLSRPQFRVRAGEFRFYYDVAGSMGQILEIIKKSESDEWLKKAGGKT